MKAEKRGRPSSTANRQMVQNREKKPSFSHSNSTAGIDETNYSVFSNVENTLQSIDALVIPSGSNSSSAVKASPKMSAAARKRAAKYEQSRPKMIHTQKMRVPVEDGKRKTKTMITRTAPKDSQLSSSGSHHVSSQNKSMQNHYNHTAEQTIIKDEDFMSRSETEILLELSRKNLKYSPDVVNDLEEILRSPIKSKEANEEYITSDPFPFENMMASSTTTSSTSTRPQRASARRSVVNQLRVAHQQHKQKSSRTSNETTKRVKYGRSTVTARASTSRHQQHDGHHHHHTNDDEEHNGEADCQSHLAPSIVIKHEKEEEYSMTGEDTMFTCEMCSAVFRDRAQLLIHVPIHI